MLLYLNASRIPPGLGSLWRRRLDDLLSWELSHYRFFVISFSRALVVSLSRSLVLSCPRSLVLSFSRSLVISLPRFLALSCFVSSFSRYLVFP